MSDNHAQLLAAGLSFAKACGIFSVIQGWITRLKWERRGEHARVPRAVCAGAPPRQAIRSSQASRPSACRDACHGGFLCRIVIDAADMTSCERVHDLFNRCRRALRSGIRHVIIDLHAVTSADTKLIACLVAFYRMARAASAQLEVKPVPGGAGDDKHLPA